MDSLVAEIFVVVVVQMLMSEASGITTSTQVSPVIVVIGKMKMAEINATELIVVADERGFVVVVEVVP